jgi:hypothetical protein
MKKNSSLEKIKLRSLRENGRTRESKSNKQMTVKKRVYMIHLLNH